MATEKNTPENQQIIDEYEAATRDVRQYGDNDNSSAAKKARTRFDKADQRRWKWRRR